MTDISVGVAVARAIEEAVALQATGEIRAAIDLLTEANRRERHVELERALVRARHEGCASCPPPVPSTIAPIVADPDGGELFEIGASDLTSAALRTGFERSGCVLVRGLVPQEQVDRLVAGIDATFDAYDASERGDAFDSDWYTPFDMPTVISPERAGAAVIVPPDAPVAGPMPAAIHRRTTRDAAGVWTVDSPRMLFEWLEVVEGLGFGELMTEFLGERPFLSANKCTLRRVPPEVILGGWHQDGAFIGEHVGAFNLWLSLSPCGRDAPGLDIVPRRLGVLTPGEHSAFPWSLSMQTVKDAAGDAGIVRPDLEAGDAVLFDHRLAHRTATSPEMTKHRHAIESWFFAPSAFPASQLPLVF